MEYLVIVLLLLVVMDLGKIDRSLKAILAELQKQNSVTAQASEAGLQPLSPEEAELQARRARIAEIQKNWPAYN